MAHDDKDFEQYDPSAVSWQLGFDGKVSYESEATDRLIGERRGQVVYDAARVREEPESLQLGKLLRKSHIKLSHRPDAKPAQTEAKMRYIPQARDASKSFAETNGAELRRSNIDLAVADPKSGKEWKSVLKGAMSSNEDAKFACAVPEGFAHMAKELRKSNVLLNAGKVDYRNERPAPHMSEQKREYHEKPIPNTVGYADTIGKDLRTSHIDLAPGDGDKHCKTWVSQQHAVLGSNNDEKWACEKPEGFYHLIAELRKTNIQLGTDKIAYGTEGVKRPILYPGSKVPGAKPRAAGHARGL